MMASVARSQAVSHKQQRLELEDKLSEAEAAGQPGVVQLIKQQMADQAVQHKAAAMATYDAFLADPKKFDHDPGGARPAKGGGRGVRGWG